MKQLFIFLSCMACLFVSSKAIAAFAFPITNKVANRVDSRQMVKVNRFVSYSATDCKRLPAKQITAKGWVQFSLKNSSEVTLKQEEQFYAADSVALLFSQTEASFLLVIDLLLFISLTVALKIIPKR